MTDILKALHDKLDATGPKLARLDSYWNGEQPAAFLSQASREALGDKFRMLSVNFPRLAVEALAERLRVTGFRIDGPDSEPDAALWSIWRRNRLEDAAAQAHTDALVYGRSFVIVWAGANGQPLVTVESPRQVAVLRDPATREVTAALKRWVAGGQGHAVLYGPDRITRYVSKGGVVDGGNLPTTGWDVVSEVPNPLGVVPVVPVVNRGRLLDVDGVSHMDDVLDLSDALNKLVLDMLVTSEHYARPRRWATGLEVIEDDEGNPVKPFSVALDDVWQSEDPATKFGQFEATGLGGYTDAAAMLTQQIGAITGLPPHYLGLNGDQPPSADAIRSAEASLVSRAYALHRTFGQAWADVARLVVAVRDGSDPFALDVETVWSNPETRTVAQAADAAAKLAGIGVPLPVVLADQLGYTPAQVDRVRQAIRTTALDSAAVDLQELTA
ncbi:phage portal protein [Isoptericola sp. NPDC060257]|uniref:phage portal protein n=1 Tax=Isoptericola sp. NPDC060257 TaxID=3347087 RepID=UPI003663653F